MTINSQTRTAGPFAGTGAIVPYPFTFKVFQASDVSVSMIDASGVYTDSVLSVGHAVTLNADQNASPGGVVTPLVAVPIGSSVSLTSRLSVVQPASLTNSGGFYPKVIEDALDRLTIIMQEQGFVASKQTLRVPELGGTVALPTQSNRANRVLAFDSAGNPITIVGVDAGSAAALSVDLANSASSTKGVGLVGFAYSLVYGAGTVGKWLRDLALSTGASFIGWVQTGTGAVTRTVQDKLRETVSVVDYGADPTGLADSAGAIAAAWAASKYITFPAGTYKASSLPNFATNNARIETIGRVVINYTGTGNGLIVDAGSGVGTKAYNIFIGPMTINGNAGATNGVYIRGITHSTFSKLRPINFPTAAMRCEFMVSNTFDEFCHSGNEAGLTIPSINGIVLEKRNAGEQSADCTFINPIIEGTSGDGIRANEANQCTFIGGTSEGNGFGGAAGAIYLGANSVNNTIIGLDMEANGKAGDATSYHVKDLGLHNKFITPLCDSTISPLFWVAGGNSGSIEGGQISALQIDAGVKNYQTTGVAYGGTWADNGTSSRHIQRFYITGAVVDMPDSYVQTKTWTPAPTGLTVVGTPTYTGTYQQIGRLIVFSVRVTSTTSTANPSGASFDLPIAASVLGVCGAASNNTSLGLGQGTGSISVTRCYPPTWAADSDVQISGQYWTS